ncbi:MAG: hypothetical protein F2667_14845 [Actinobacteria bacterium]|uniref:Unannotated protein n=1 Tax=freshwater metagenome TaxID=449393 RepID=A0A6J6SJK0_9ZZZZ|nr:hypothetical protein [Actinomycetota bacterium]
MPFAADVLTFALRLVEQGPEPEDVKAGWTAFAIFLALVAVVIFLGFSLFKQLRRVEAARKAGVYGEPAEEPSERV